MNRPKTLEEFKAIGESAPIAIFGAGKGGRRVFGALSAAGLVSEAYLDNYKNGYDEITGVQIFRPEQWLKEHKNALIINAIQTKEAQRAVDLQLIETLGISPDCVFSITEISFLFAKETFTWDNSREKEFDFHANDSRIELMAKWIKSTDSSVADLGCGAQYLRKLIPLECRYIPVDYISRSPDTVVCDLNGQLPDLDVDVVFASGILTLISDLEKFVNWLCDVAKKKIILNLACYNDTSSTHAAFWGRASIPTPELLYPIFQSKGFFLADEQVIWHGDTQVKLLCYERQRSNLQTL